MQEDLAAKVQVEGALLKRDSISRIEMGTRFAVDYERLLFARVPGVTAEWLLSGEENLDSRAET